MYRATHHYRVIQRCIDADPSHQPCQGGAHKEEVRDQHLFQTMQTFSSCILLVGTIGKANTGQTVHAPEEHLVQCVLQPIRGGSAWLLHVTSSMLSSLSSPLTL